MSTTVIGPERASAALFGGDHLGSATSSVVDGREGSLGARDDAARHVRLVRGETGRYRTLAAICLARRMLEGGSEAVAADDDVVGDQQAARAREARA